MEKQLSDPQLRILAYIRRSIREEGLPPTNREIGEAVEIASTGHIDHHLAMLEKKGYILREKRKSRGIRLVESVSQSATLPANVTPFPQPAGLQIRGTIAAGQPLDIFADDQVEVLDLAAVAAGQADYVLQVRGESMIDDHIASGDFVVIGPGEDVHNGDIIVATRKTGNGDGGAATLKRFYRENGRVRLQPANEKMEPIFVSAREWNDEWVIQGKVKAVFRRWSH